MSKHEWSRRIKKDLLLNPASTAAQISARLKTSDAAVQRAIWPLTRGGKPHVSASGALDNPTTTYTWIAPW